MSESAPGPEPAGRGRTAAPFVIAHRGSSADAPENTIAAFDRALGTDGAEGLELDVHRTRDGVVVVLHDDTVDRTTNGHGRVEEIDFHELRELDAGAGFVAADGSQPFAGRGVAIPSLEEVLARYPEAWLSIDLKQGDPVTEQAVVSLVDRFGARDRVVVSAESSASARRLAALDPDLPRFFDRDAARAFYRRHLTRFWWGYRPPAHSLQIPVTHRGRALDTPRLIADAHRFGIAVRYWTVNDRPTMERLIERGADGIITDRPARLRDLLVSKGLR